MLHHRGRRRVLRGLQRARRRPRRGERLGSRRRRASQEELGARDRQLAVGPIRVPRSSRSFLDLLASDFGAGVVGRRLPHRPRTAAREAINGWVDEHTDGRIPQLLAEGTITPDSRLTLVNTVYLKAPWRQPVRGRATSTAPFTTADGTSVDVEMMHVTQHLAATGDGWQAVEAAVRRRPVGDAPGAAGRRPGHAGGGPLRAWPASRTSPASKCGWAFPDGTSRHRRSLGACSPRLGMPTAFTDGADFTGMTTEEPLYIGAVIHQANITVDEAGTEAAAATAVVMDAGAAPNPGRAAGRGVRPPVPVRRPRHADRRGPLQGRITNPSG